MPTRISVEESSVPASHLIANGKTAKLNGRRVENNFNQDPIQSKFTEMPVSDSLTAVGLKTNSVDNSIYTNGTTNGSGNAQDKLGLSTSGSIISAVSDTKTHVQEKKVKIPPRVFKSNIIESYKIPNDTVRLSHDLYEDLASPKYVTIQCLTNELQGIPWTLFRAEVDEALNPNTCAIKSSINSISVGTNSSQPRVVQIANTDPVYITHAIVSVDAEFYHQHQNNPHNGILLTQLRQSHILRQGELHPEVDGGCRIRICEPVDQGLFDPAKIKLTVVCDNHVSTVSLLSPNSNGSIGMIQNASSASLESDDSLDVEISKFLDVDDDEDQDNTLAASNGPSATLSVSVLQRPIFVDTLTPTPEPFDDMESVAYVRIEQLAKIGSLSGDIVCSIC
ncbi:peroxin-6 [Sugiyamaella lignohabitans]|uniref:Peroxin-6 n=1 Tax=Sugiyamaella lignohabitans TaxID=796027 RepID=A0A161HLG7_9ASCO|nr:peroxin-6 [Sugiyamaella lignohabitans]ANB12918.1 peroxin-6 [Sugiyamaella lignohabitans]